MDTLRASQGERVPAHMERELALEREFHRVFRGRVMVWSGREGSVWVQWQPHGDVVLYDVASALAVLITFADGQCADGADLTLLAMALENAGAYITNLSQYPWE